MKHKYVVCIASDTPLNESVLEQLALSQDIVFVEKVYSEVESSIEFEQAWQNGTDAITERQAYYNDINQVFMGMIGIFQRQGIIKEDGTFDIENYTTASVVHFATKMITLGISKVNEKADRIKAEIKEAKQCLKLNRTPDGFSLTQELIEHYEAILEKHSEAPFRISAAMALPIQMILKTLNSSFQDGGREINFDFETMAKDMNPLADIMAKWCVKAATGSPVVINFIRDANLLSEEDLAKLAIHE